MLVRSTKPTLRLRVLVWWYGWTIPPLPSVNATLKQREKFRRACAASKLLLFMNALMLLSLLIVVLQAIFVGNIHFPVVLVATQLFFLFLGVLNRRGWTAVVALCLIAAVTLSTFTLILNKADGISVDNLLYYDGLIGSLLLAVMLLPLPSILFIAVANLILVVASLYFFASPSLAIMLQTSFGSIIAHFVNIEAMVVVICWLWGTSMAQELQRADRAQEITKLEQAISAQNRVALEEKKQLEEVIQAVTKTITAVANGNYNVRVPINPQNILWPLAGALNNLLSRIQSWRRDSLELAQLRAAVTQLTRQIGEARQTGNRLVLSHTGTMLDTLFIEMQRLQQTEISEQYESALLQLLERFAAPDQSTLQQEIAKKKVREY